MSTEGETYEGIGDTLPDVLREMPERDRVCDHVWKLLEPWDKDIHAHDLELHALLDTALLAAYRIGKEAVVQQSAGDHAEIERLQQRNIELLEDAENAQQRMAALLAKLEATGTMSRET